MELLHQKLDDPHALPDELADELPDDLLGDQNTHPPAQGRAISRQRLHHLARHWSTLTMPMIRLEHATAEPGQPAWERVLDVLSHAAVRHRSDALQDQIHFAAEVVDSLADWLSSGWAAYEKQQATLPWQGCFRVDVDAQGQAWLHFYNACRPQSPFENLQDRQAELRHITQQLRAQGRAHTVYFTTWLNNLPRVRQLFPSSFIASLKPKGLYPDGLGWWGQIITRQSQIHPKKAQQIREKKGQPLPRLQGSCPLSDMPK